MKPLEIKAEITRKGITFTDIADAAGCSVQEVSMCISGERLYMPIREFVAKALNKEVDKVFNKHHPKPKRKAA